MTESTKTMQQGDDPADFTVDEVNAYLGGDPLTADEHERVLQAERDGKARSTIKGVLPDEPAEADPSYDDVVERGDVGTTDAFIIPNHNTIPQDAQDEDAARRNEELEDAGVNQPQGFIGSDGSANLLS